jgi:hypothetical protein
MLYDQKTFGLKRKVEAEDFAKNVNWLIGLLVKAIGTASSRPLL